MIYQGKSRHLVNTIIIHCTATPSGWMPGKQPEDRVAAIRRMHREERGWRDIGYHWLIDRDGTMLPGRKETEVGAHVAGHNAGTLGVSLFGGLSSQPRHPFLRHYTPRQETALIDLIEWIKSRTPITKIIGHNQLDGGKACPGFWVPDWLREHDLAG